MSISIDPTSAYINNLTNTANNRSNANKIDKLNASAGNLSATSTKEEITDAVKSFEQYFVEQMLKQMQESAKVFSEDEEDQLTSYYMDFAVSEVAKQMVDQYGGRITEDFVAQIQRNYGVPLNEAKDNLED